jgi:hypothetical protein
VKLSPSKVPLVHSDGAVFHFSADQMTAKKPMLMNAVQGIRRVYTLVSIKLQLSPETVELRKYSYIKEFNEWKSPNHQEKKTFQAAGGTCRYDILTVDGSLALELEVPSGTNSLLDYYFVRQASLNVHMDEILHHAFKSVQPERNLSLPNSLSRGACSLKVRNQRLTTS